MYIKNWTLFRRRNCEHKQGFTLLELLIVLTVSLVIASIAIPNMWTIISNARLRGGATNLAGLLQNSRMLAVKENRTKTTHFTVLANGPVAYVKNPTDTSPLTSRDPQVQLGSPLTQYDTPSGPAAPPVVDNAVLGFTPVTTDPSFNSRGLPCAYSGGSCTTSGFIYYFKDRRPFGESGWAAVSISPAGRIKRWGWNGSAWGD